MREEEILKFWQENKIFEKSLAKPSPKGEFVFYDGPPFATGLPHYGHLLGSTVKDVFPRYKTMRGYHVRRRWGWDTHGLPIENIVEKKLGLKSKKDIEQLGIEKFNELCRAQVLEYVNEWKRYVERLARWVDFDNSYKTMDANYTESVWWALKQMHDKGFLYEGRKVLLYCPHCETPLAKAEIAMDNSYKDITEEAVTVEFRLKGEPNTSLLAWTTTPWTLPANVALAVHPEIVYVTIEKKDMGAGELVRFVLAKDRLEAVFGKDDYKIINERKGKALENLEYEPLYELEAVKKTGKRSHYVALADFVSTEEGTGIVHTAVIYGEDDYQLGLKNDLPMVPLLNPNGTYNNDAPEFLRGQYIKKADKLVIEDLEKRGLLFDKVLNTHSYPHCYRCGTALIYNALSSWFVNIQKIKSRMLELNENVNWVPEYLKHGRFQNIVENAPDWTISRNRYWASPLPIWKHSPNTGVGGCDRVIVIGSLKELGNLVSKSGNSYFLMRHGEAVANLTGAVSTIPGGAGDKLTDKGREQVERTADTHGKVDLVFHSQFARSRETAGIYAAVQKISNENIIEDERLGEFPVAGWEGRTWGELWKEKPRITVDEEAVRGKLFTFFAEIESKYKGKRILVVSHDLPMVILTKGEPFENAQVREFNYVPLPRNGRGEIDLHRPYIDEVKIRCDPALGEAGCGGTMSRIPEVVDCWVESGCMPFAEYHYPFENKEEFEKRYPGDFITEYIAQTRTWFYYTHAVGAALFDSESFKNVVSTGTILAADGSKMSKSKGNYPDPLILIEKYGADALRYHLMTSVVMQAEDLNFREDDVKEVHQRLINILKNVVTFYQTYTDPELQGPPLELSKGGPSAPNVLDIWITARLSELHKEVTENLDKFDTIRAGRPIRDFVTDLSTWYIRRSRDRFKSTEEVSPPDTGGLTSVAATTHFVLLELSKLIAPFMPYLAEEVYRAVGGEKESVHLEDWTPLRQDFAGQGLNSDIFENMRKTREVVSLTLEERQKAGIKVRQPLASLEINVELGEEYLALIRDEVNVKEVKVGSEITLDTQITPELELEGKFRDLLREIQDKRKELGLSPADKISVTLPHSLSGLTAKYEVDIKKSVNAESLSVGPELIIQKI